MKVYDCFPFNHELDLLELRLHTLADTVHKHVLAESELTSRGEPKPLYFADNRQRFSEFADKIIHIVVRADEMTRYIRPKHKGDHIHYAREGAQRDAMARGLIDAQPDDIIMISDADEIIRPEAIAQFRPRVTVADVQMYRYYFNLRSAIMQKPISWFERATTKTLGGDMEWAGPVMVRFRDFPGCSIMMRQRWRFYPRWRLDRVGPFQKPFRRHNPHIVRDGGWHFHSVMNAADLERKLHDSAHSEWGSQYDTREKVESLLEQASSGQTIDNPLAEFLDAPAHIEPLDESFPPYLLANRERFADRILPDPAQ